LSTTVLLSESQGWREISSRKEKKTLEKKRKKEIRNKERKKKEKIKKSMLGSL